MAHEEKEPLADAPEEALDLTKELEEAAKAWLEADTDRNYWKERALGLEATLRRVEEHLSLLPDPMQAEIRMMLGG